MKQPSSTEAHIADLVQTKINSKVAIHTHICFMSMMEDWLDEMDPFVKWQDYSVPTSWTSWKPFSTYTKQRND